MNDTGYEHRSIHNAAPQRVVYGDRRDNGSCFWKVFFAVILTAAITFAVTAGGMYMLFVNGQLPQDRNAVEPDHAMRISTRSSKTTGLTFSDDPETVEALQKLVDVYSLLKDNYYEALSEAELLEIMTEGLANTMASRYTFYLTKEANEMVEESLSGEYSGIGAMVEQLDNNVYRVSNLFEDSPALEAGMRIGDFIEAVDGEPAANFTGVSHLASVVRGESGTEVTITIYRESSQERMDIVITRGTIHNPSVSQRMLSDEIGYIHVTEFSQQVSTSFTKAVDSLVAQGAKHIVFDLRNNGGGYADECVAMVDYLTGEATVASIKGRRQGKDFSEVWQSDAKKGVPDAMRFAILMNEFSASASELFAGALHDYGVATLIGEQSYGKGVGTLTYPLSDGSAVQVTNFEYFLPNGESIQDVGLTPDIEVFLSDDVSGLPLSMIADEDDAQLQQAIEVLQALLD